jgi:hypothetical protein
MHEALTPGFGTVHSDDAQSTALLDHIDLVAV